MRNLSQKKCGISMWPGMPPNHIHHPRSVVMKQKPLLRACVSFLTSIQAVVLAAAIIGSACASDNKPGEHKSGETQTRSQQSREKKAASSGENEPAAAQDTSKKTSAVVDVYLFHGKNRCRSCNKMEDLTKEAIAEDLSAEKSTGAVRYQHVNVEAQENRHFVQDYKLRSISIVVSKKVDGRETEWNNLEKVWQLLRNDEKFKQYVVKEISAYLPE
jgi:hypothetical protein